jgi:hypothetical protein
MMKRGRLGIFSIASGASILLACNGLLKNDPRHLAEEARTSGGGGGAGHAGSANAGSANAGKGSQGKAGDGSAGVSGNGAGGEPEGEAGSGARPGISGEAGETGASGRAGEGGEAGGGGAGNANQAGSAGSAGTAGSGPSCVGECVPGATMMGVQACGDCGTQSRMGTCTDECQWQWGDFGECMSSAECHPTAVATRTANCACGGSKGQSQTCGSDCRWGAWVDTSSCDLDCCTAVEWCDTPDNISGVPASRGTWCKQKNAACTHAEVDADCPSSVAAIDCVMHDVVFIEYL